MVDDKSKKFVSRPKTGPFKGWIFTPAWTLDIDVLSDEPDETPTPDQSKEPNDNPPPHQTWTPR
jgi:hypothetical protein